MGPASRPSAGWARARPRLLDAIRSRNGVTRAELAALTGLSRSSVAAAVRELLEDGVVAEQAIPARGKGSGRGRPSSLLVPAAGRGLVGALDLGHAHIGAAIADTDGVVLAEGRRPVAVDSRPAESIETASGMLSDLLRTCERTLDDVRVVTAGIPAPLDLRTHRPRSVLDEWRDVDLARELGERLGRPTQVANDAELGGQGELRFGAARGLRDFVYVKASEGVGASLVLDGEVHRGASGLAGEIGHVMLSERGGMPCRCGNRGCLETVLSTNLIEERFRQIATGPTDPVFPLRGLVDDVVMTTYVSESARTLGRVLADLCNWLNPQAIIIGGVLGTAGQPAVTGVTEAIARFTTPLLREGLQVRAAELGLRSELLGAVALACRYAAGTPAPEPE